MKEENRAEMLQSLIEEIKKEKIDYNDFIGGDICLIDETVDELINGICGRYANIEFYLMKIGEKDSEELLNKRIALRELKLALALSRNYDLKKQAIEYLSRISKELHKQWEIYYDLYLKIDK
jgi:hypothetical protein